MGSARMGSQRSRNSPVEEAAVSEISSPEGAAQCMAVFVEKALETFNERILHRAMAFGKIDQRTFWPSLIVHSSFRF
jgi:hypothetical protein